MGKKRKALVAVDLHGTLQGKDGEPEPNALESMQELKNDGHEIGIFTCGPTDEAKAWLDEHGFPYDYVNEDIPTRDSNKPDADLIVDNSAIRYDGDWNRTLAEAYSTGRLDKSLCVIKRKDTCPDCGEALEKARDPQDIKEFAAEVNRIARSAPKSARFGDKVYIGYVEYECSINGFREKLLEAQRAGLVTLSRLDMPEAADPRDVRASTMYDATGFGEYQLIRPKSLDKQAMEVACPGCHGAGCTVCDGSGMVQVADDKSKGGTIMPEGMMRHGLEGAKRLAFIGKSRSGGAVYRRVR